MSLTPALRPRLSAGVANYTGHAVNPFNLIEALQVLVETQNKMLDMQQRLSSELEEAEAYFNSLLPEKLRTESIGTDYEFISCSQLGGDMLGYHWLDEKEGGRLAIYLLDVSGHGLGASLLSVSVRNILRRESLPGVDFGNPAQVLQALNAAFPMEHNQGRYITAWFGVYDPDSRLLIYASAGHPPAILQAPTKELELLNGANVILGIDPSVEYSNEQAKMPCGSRLWLYSDGAFEARSARGKVLGIGGLADLVGESRGAARPVEYVLDKIRNFQRTENFEDDLAVLEFKFK